MVIILSYLNFFSLDSFSDLRYRSSRKGAWSILKVVEDIHPRKFIAHATVGISILDHAHSQPGECWACPNMVIPGKTAYEACFCEATKDKEADSLSMMKKAFQYTVKSIQAEIQPPVQHPASVLRVSASQIHQTGKSEDH